MLYRKKETTRAIKWKKFTDEKKYNELKTYLAALSKTFQKKKSTSFEDGSKPDKMTPKKPAIGTKKWRELVDSMAADHPKPPKSIYTLFKRKAKEVGVKDQATLKSLYQSKSDELYVKAKTEFDQLNSQYKEDVHIWIESLDENTREKYEGMYMRGAKSSDAHNRTAQLQEAAATDLSYLDLQPKTPAYRMCAESDDEDQIEELS